jgi:hypothetical protein
MLRNIIFLPFYSRKTSAIFCSKKTASDLIDKPTTRKSNEPKLDVAKKICSHYRIYQEAILHHLSHELCT